MQFGAWPTSSAYGCRCQWAPVHTGCSRLLTYRCWTQLPGSSSRQCRPCGTPAMTCTVLDTIPGSLAGSFPKGNFGPTSRNCQRHSWWLASLVRWRDPRDQTLCESLQLKGWITKNGGIEPVLRYASERRHSRPLLHKCVLGSHIV